MAELSRGLEQLPRTKQTRNQQTGKDGSFKNMNSTEKKNYTLFSKLKGAGGTQKYKQGASFKSRRKY